MNAIYQSTRLPNGITIATASMEHMESVCCGLWALVGSRHEPLEQNGIAHFVEHLLFKGTPTRDPYAITREIEGLGASVDAFTTEDHTCFYTRGPAEMFPHMADVLTDLYIHPTFDPGEMEREREVVLEEIAMYRENPSQHVEDLLGVAAWPDHPLGMPITGRDSTVKSLRRGDLFRYHQNHYTGANTLVTVAGRVSHEEVLDELADRLIDLPEGEPATFDEVPRALRTSGPRSCHEIRDVEQAHLCIGFHAPDRRDPDRFPLKMLNVMLGENMSSRLFQVLREQHGLCYSIYSDVIHLHDTGLLSIYTGLDLSNVTHALDLSAQCLREFATAPVPRDQLQRAVNFSVGQCRMALETSLQQMMWVGESLLAHHEILEPEDVFSELRHVTPDDVQRVAADVFRQDRSAIAYIGSEIPEFALGEFLD